MVLFVSRKEEHEQEVFLVARNVIVKSKQWKESSFQLLASWKERSRWTGVGYILIFSGASCTWPVAISESWGHQDTGPLPRLGQTPAKKVGQHVLLSFSLSSVFANSFFALPLSPASPPLHSSFTLAPPWLLFTFSKFSSLYIIHLQMLNNLSPFQSTSSKIYWNKKFVWSHCSDFNLFPEYILPALVSHSCHRLHPQPDMQRL